MKINIFTKTQINTLNLLLKKYLENYSMGLLKMMLKIALRA